MPTHGLYNDLKKTNADLTMGDIVDIASLAIHTNALSAANITGFTGTLIKHSISSHADPKKLLFITPGVENAESITGINKITANPTILHTDIDNFEDNLVDFIREKVKKEGTLEEIAIFAHAHRQMMVSTDERVFVGREWWGKILSGKEYDDHWLNVGSFLDKLDGLGQELGIKITDRIVFAGCNVFSDLESGEVKAYRDWAKKNEVEVVGSTSTMLGGPFSTARFTQFTPHGDVIEDKISASEFNPIKWALIGLSGRKPYEWLTCHSGKTQKEGSACQNTFLDPSYMDLNSNTFGPRSQLKDEQLAPRRHDGPLVVSGKISPVLSVN